MITRSFSSRRVCGPRLMPFAPARSLRFFLLRRQNRCGMSDDIPLSATSCSCSRCDTPSRFGHPVLHDAWTARVPAPVAEEAIKRGLALDADTDAAREKMTEMASFADARSARMPAVTVEDTIDLGVNLAEEVEPSETAQRE